MSAIDKTKKIVRVMMPLGLMEKNPLNPNKMKKREFDLLCDNLEQTGWTDPAVARPIDLKKATEFAKKAGWPCEPEDFNQKLFVELCVKAGIKFRIVGGHHRYDAASYLQFEKGPLNIILDPKFDQQAEEFQLVRMNMIHGHLDAPAFIELYSKYAAEYGDDVLQDAFGFSDDAEFQRLIKQTAKAAFSDPSDQKKFMEAAKEVKTIDGLHKLLNEMFTKYGDTLPYGYMVFTDQNNKRSMWLRVSEKTMKALDIIGDICISNKRTVDDIVGQTLQLIARGDQQAFIDALVAETEEVELPSGLQAAPTMDHLDKLKELDAA